MTLHTLSNVESVDACGIWCSHFYFFDILEDSRPHRFSTEGIPETVGMASCRTSGSWSSGIGSPSSAVSGLATWLVMSNIAGVATKTIYMYMLMFDLFIHLKLVSILKIKKIHLNLSSRVVFSKFARYPVCKLHRVNTACSKVSPAAPEPACTGH